MRARERRLTEMLYLLRASERRKIEIGTIEALGLGVANRHKQVFEISPFRMYHYKRSSRRLNSTFSLSLILREDPIAKIKG